MDYQADWLARRKYVEADPEQQRLNAAHKELCSQISKLNSELRTGTYTLQRLLLARDCVQHYADEIGCTTPDEDEQLERWTATHGEAWFGVYAEATKELTESVLDLCDVLTTKRQQRNALRQEKEAAYELVRCRTEQLERDYAASKAAKAG